MHVTELSRAFAPLTPTETRPLPPETSWPKESDELASLRREVRRLRTRQEDMFALTMIVVVVTTVLTALHTVFATRTRS
jgi:hypothetical protein